MIFFQYSYLSNMENEMSSENKAILVLYVTARLVTACLFCCESWNIYEKMFTGSSNFIHQNKINLGFKTEIE